MLSLRRSTILAEVHERRGTVARASVGASARVEIEVDGARGAPCPCVQSAAVGEVLKYMNMPHAAGMHTAVEGDAEWCARDWYLHAREEDREFFPRLRRVADRIEMAGGGADASSIEATWIRREVDDLIRDHRLVVYPAVERGEVPPDDLARKHGAREDALVRRYARYLLEEAGAPAEVRTGIDVMFATDYTPPTPSDGSDDPGYQAMKSLPGLSGLSYDDYRRIRREVDDPEKFRDPRYTCSSDDSAAYGYLYAIPTAEEEASVAGGFGSLRARIRVARMRKKVNDFGKKKALEQPGVNSIYEPSLTSIIQNVSDVVNDYQAVVDKRITPKELQAFSDKIGVSVDEITAKAPSILAGLGGNAGQAVKDLLPTVWAAIGPQVMRVFKSIADEAASLRAAGADAASGALGDATALIPIFNAVFKASMAILEAEEADKHAQCVDYVDTYIKNPIVRTMKEGLPYPWHVIGLPVECSSKFGAAEKWVPTSTMEFMAKALGTNLKRFDAIDPIGNAVIVASMRRWWALANQLMAYGDVAAIFGALGNDRSGGNIASDEQVVLVAAPIAASYGLPIWDFAQALYDQSLGWRDPAVAGLLAPEPERAPLRDSDGNIVHGGCTEHCSKWDPLPAVYDVDPYVWECKDEAANVAQIDWGVLARDAFALAERAKRGEVVGLMPQGFLVASRSSVPEDSDATILARPSGSSSGLHGSAVPLAIGGASAAALAVAGATATVAIAPIAAAIAWILLSAPSKTIEAPAGLILAKTGRAIAASDPRSNRRTILATVKTGESYSIAIASTRAIGHDHEPGAVHGLSPYDLHHANASRYKAWEELVALEDHLAGDWCPDCVSKHTGAAIKFLREARSLDDGAEVDLNDARAIAELRPRVREALEEVRAIRKRIGERVGVRKLVERGHVDEDCGCGEAA